MQTDSRLASDPTATRYEWWAFDKNTGDYDHCGGEYFASAERAQYDLMDTMTRSPGRTDVVFVVGLESEIQALSGHFKPQGSYACSLGMRVVVLVAEKK